MSHMSSPFATGTKFIDYDRKTEQQEKPKSDSIFLRSKIGNWEVLFNTYENGRVQILASKRVGRLQGAGQSYGTIEQNSDLGEARISLKLETSIKRVPNLKEVNSYHSHRASYDNPQWVEIDDRLERTTESFKKEDEHYKREYPASSVLTASEFFNEVIPGFEKLLKDKKIAEYITEISEETSRVQKPYNRNYVQGDK